MTEKTFEEASRLFTQINNYEVIHNRITRGDMVDFKELEGTTIIDDLSRCLVCRILELREEFARLK